jgi:LPXTG-motif cell wall-anchored protein
MRRSISQAKVCACHWLTLCAGGMSTGELAAAIAAPVAGVLLLGGGLLLWWLRRRKRSRFAGPVPLEYLKADGGIALVGVGGKGNPLPNGGELQVRPVMSDCMAGACVQLVLTAVRTSLC